MAQYPPFYGAATVSGGAATVTFRGRDTEPVQVTQVAAEMSGAAAAAGNIRRNGQLVCPFVPTGDATAGDPPIPLWPGDELTVEWTGAPVGGVGKATIFYEPLVR